MSESTLINAFLKLQATEHSNIFEAAKKMKGKCSSCAKMECECGPMKEEKAKKDWDKDGKIESGKDEYLGSRIAAAKKAGKMEEELKGDQDKIDANKNGKIDADDFRKLRSKKKMDEEVEQVDEVLDTNMKKLAYVMKANKSIKKSDPNDIKQANDIANRTIGVQRVLKKLNKEEVEFSEAELAHFEAVIARKDQKGKEKGIGDTVDSADLTDEYINEMAQRGVKAGTKRGSYKKKATDLQGNRAASADVGGDEGSKGVPHVLDQIRHGHEDEHGYKTITHPASSPEAPVTKRIHRSELHGFYDRYHNTEKPAAKEKEYSSFLGKHFGDSRSSAPTHKSVTTDLSKIEKSNLKGGGAKPSLGGSKLVGGNK